MLLDPLANYTTPLMNCRYLLLLPLLFFACQGDDAPEGTQPLTIVVGRDTISVTDYRDTTLDLTNAIYSLDVTVNGDSATIYLIDADRPYLILGPLDANLAPDNTIGQLLDDDNLTKLLSPGTVFTKKDDSPPPVNKSM